MDHDPYGLSDRPFQLTPDPRFYYESSTHRKAMTYLGYGLAQGEGFIVVTGEVGTGKTMLVGRLMATIDRSRLTAINLVSTQLEGEDILRIVALALGVATDVAAKGQLLARIERFLHEQARGGKRTLLIVDEAQNLPISALEELRMLSNFQYGGQALLQIFLLGQPEFRDALAQPRFEQLRQRVIATHHLTAMGPDEVAPYIMHRLACAGWKGTPRFTQDAYQAFHRLSGGIPRRLNMLAGRVMLQGAIERLIDIDGEVVDDVAADLASESIMPAEGPKPLAQAFPHQPEPTVPSSPLGTAVTPPSGSYSSYAPPEEEDAPPAQSYDNRPSSSFSVPDDPFAGLDPNIPPPSIEQPPRYDGNVPSNPDPLSPPLAAEPAPLPPIEHPFFDAAEPSAPASFTPAPAPIAAPPPFQQPAAHVPPSFPEKLPPSFPETLPPMQPGGPLQPPSAPAPAALGDPAAYAARNAELEARLADQEAMLRRTLSLLVELVDTDPAAQQAQPAPPAQPPQQPGTTPPTPSGGGGNQDAA